MAEIEIPMPTPGSPEDGPVWTPPVGAAPTSYPARVGWAPGAQLAALGLARDQLGRLRTAAGLYVCGWSGRVHAEYLLPAPWMDPWAGVVRMVWVDRETTRELRRAIVAGAKAKASAAIGGFLGRLFRELLGLLEGKL